MKSDLICYMYIASSPGHSHVFNMKMWEWPGDEANMYMYEWIAMHAPFLCCMLYMYWSGSHYSQQ